VIPKRTAAGFFKYARNVRERTRHVRGNSVVPANAGTHTPCILVWRMPSKAMDARGYGSRPSPGRRRYDCVGAKPSLRAQRSNPGAAREELDCFVASLLAMTLIGPRHTSAFSRHTASESCKFISPRKQEGAGKTGCTPHPRSRVQKVAKRSHTSIQVQRKHPGLPCAMALQLIPCSPR
jgi:hypothetical protein